jgi:diacylglycerol kinase (ATP)
MTPPDLHRALLIVNPASRRGSRLRERAAAAIEEAGMRCNVLVTSAQGDAGRAVAADSGAYDVIFTLGGDGTVMEVLSATPETGPPVGILHGGTGNLIAQALGVPYAIRPAVRALVAGRVGQIDLGRLADGRRFAVAAGVGIDATMTAEATPSLKRRLGVLAYIVLGARALLRFERFKVRIDVDGRTHEQEAVAVLVANFGTLLHDFITLGDGISYDDGQLNVCVFSPGTVRESLRVARRLLRRDFRPDPCIWYAAGRRIAVVTDPPRIAQADGELLGLTPLVAEVEPLRGRVLLPRRTGRRSARGAPPAHLQPDNPTRRIDG